MERLINHITDTIGDIKDTAETLNIDLCEVYQAGDGFDILSRYDWELAFNKYVWSRLNAEYQKFLVNAYEIIQGDTITEAMDIDLSLCDGDTIIDTILKSDLSACADLANKYGDDIKDCFECADNDGVYFLKYAIEL